MRLDEIFAARSFWGVSNFLLRQRPRFIIVDCARSLTEQRYAVKDYYPSTTAFA